MNWYASLVLIVIVGLLLVGFSRYQRTHPNSPSSGPPTTSDVWNVALGIDICGTTEPNLPADPKATGGFTTDGSGVLRIAPKDDSESGSNATLGKFVSEYKGLVLTADSVQYPGKSLMTNGEKCPKGTPDAGKQGFVNVQTWPSFSSKQGTVVGGNPTQLKFTSGQMITIAFLPAGANIPKPPADAITALINAQSGATTTTTTAPAGDTSTTAATGDTSTTAASGDSTTTAPPATTTTAPPTTTTAPPGTTTTTASGGGSSK